MTVDRAVIVRAYYPSSSRGGDSVIDLAHITGPTAADVDNQILDAGSAYSFARRARLPLPVLVRVRGLDTLALYIDGGWRGTFAIPNPTELAIGAVSLLLAVVIAFGPEIGRMAAGRQARRRAGTRPAPG